MLKYSGERPQRKKRYRPEYALVPRVAPDIRVYVPEKPVQRTGVHQNASQRSATTNEMKRRADVETRSMLSETVEREVHAAESGEVLHKMRSYTARHAAPEGAAKVDLNTAAVQSRMAKKSYIPRHATPEDLDVDSQKNARTYVPRHAAPEDISAEETSRPVPEIGMRRTRLAYQPTVEQDFTGVQEIQSRTPDVALRVVDDSVYDAEEYEQKPAPQPVKHAFGSSPKRVNRVVKPEGEYVVRNDTQMPKAGKFASVSSAVPLRVVDESVYGAEEIESAPRKGRNAARTEVAPRRNRPYRMNETQALMDDSDAYEFETKAVGSPRRRKEPAHRPASDYAVKPVDSRNRKKRIILLGIGLAITIALLVGLMLPGGLLTRETPPLSTVGTSQLFTDGGGDESAAAGAIATPTPTAAATMTPSSVTSTATATATAAATPMPTATAKVTATPTATVKPTATPKPTIKPTATVQPTQAPTPVPTAAPTVAPTQEPTPVPTAEPTVEPTAEPSVETSIP